MDSEANLINSNNLNLARDNLPATYETEQKNYVQDQVN